jgi:diguanylate cyclase (GGDEF)-like protein
MRTFQEVESLSVTDELTRIYNYRFLKAALQREVERAARYGQVFSILMLDVDHLKAYNEVHGHLGGSELLRRMAEILSQSSRAIDLVAKYGGDEFLLILPQTNTDGAMVMGNRICKAVAKNEFQYCKPGDITVSGGVSSFPQHGASMEALLAAADEALFTAKRGGRNCVIAATRPGQPGRITRAA